MVPRFPSDWQVFRAGPRRRRAIAIACLAGALLLGAWAAPAAWAQDARAFAGDVQALMETDVAAQWAALARLREHPDAAREALLGVLGDENAPAGRWRLIYRMVEFGRAEDVPLLLKLREGARDAWERGVAEGAARALYDPVGGATGLEGVVQDFAFIQTRRPNRSGRENAWRLTSWSLADYHRDGLPLRMIRRLQNLRNKTYSGRADLAEAMQRQVGPRDWKAHQERLLASAEAVYPTVTLQGLARVRLSNPLDRPVLLAVSLDVWYGRFDTPPVPAWVYLPPRGAQTVDLPVTPQGSANRDQLRIDLRLGEVNGAMIPGFHKLYLPLQF